jgi:hypothetical protein
MGRNAHSSVEARRAAGVPKRPTQIAPLAPERYKVQVTVSRKTYDKLCRAHNACEAEQWFGPMDSNVVRERHDR